MQLDQLVFSVDSTQLDEARIKIAKLGDAVGALNKPLQDMARSSAKTNEVIAKSELAAEKARAATKALGEQVEDSGEQMSRTEAYIDKLVNGLKIFRGETITVQDSALKLGDSFTKGQANALAYQMQIGATTDQLKLIAKQFQDINAFSNTNPFDKSTRGLSALRQEITELQMVDKFMRDGIALTREQIVNLAKDSERLTQAYKSMGKSQEELTSELARLKTQTIEAAKEKNILTEAARQSEIQARKEADALIEQSRAIKLVNDAMMKEWANKQDSKDPVLADMASFYKQQGIEADALAAKVAKLENAEAKLAFTNKELAAGLSTASANALFAYKKGLEEIGTSSEQVTEKMKAFREQLVIKQQHSPITGIAKDAKAAREQVDHLSRAIGVQLGDVAVSLAGGMNPFLVLIQQGDQLRFAVQAAKDSGQDLEAAMSNALTGIVRSFVDTGKVIGGFFVDSLRTAGKVIVDFGTYITGVSDKYKLLQVRLAMASDVGNVNAAVFYRMIKLIPQVIGTLVGLAAVIGVTLVGAYFSAIKQTDALAEQLILTGGSLGMSKNAAISYAQSLGDVGVSTSKTIDVMSAMAKEGGFAAKEISTITKAAVDMYKYGGVAIEDTVKAFAKMKDEPVNALIELGKQTGMVSAETLNSVAALEQQGKTSEAAAIAVRALADVNSEQVERMKRDYSALGSLLIDVKGWFVDLWDAAKGVVYEPSANQKALGALNDAIELLKQAEKSANASGSLSIRPSEAALRILKERVNARAEEYRAIVLGQKAEEDARVASSAASKAKERQLALEMQNYSSIERAQANILKYKGEIEAAEKATLLTEDQRKINSKLILELQKAIAKEEENITKERNKGAKAASFSPASDNTITNIKKQYEEQLKVISDNEKTKQDQLKGQYDATLLSLGEFQAKELAQIQEAEAEKLRLVDSYEKQYKDAILAREQALKSEASSAIKQGAASVEVNKELKNSLENLGREAQTAYDHFKNLRNGIENAADKRFVQSFNESAKAIRANNKELENLRTTLEVDYRLNVKAVEVEQAAAAMNELDAVAYKARLASLDTSKKMQHYVTLQNQALSAAQAYEDFVANSAVNPETIARAKQLADIAKAARANLLDADRLIADYAEKQSEIAVKQKYLEKFKEIQNELSDVMFLALTGKGAEAGKKLREMIKAKLMEPITVIINAVIGDVFGGAIASLLSLVGIKAPAGLTAGNVSSLINGANTAKDFYSTVTGGFGGVGASVGAAFNKFAMSSFGQSLGLSSSVSSTTLSNAGNLGSMGGGTGLTVGGGTGLTSGGSTGLQAGTATGGLTDLGKSISSSLSNIATSAASVIAGNAMRKLFSDGYSMGGGMETFQDVATMAAEFFLPGIGGAIAGAISGLFNRTFGRKLKEVGIEGVFGGEEGFVGNQYKFEKGGLLRSDKTSRSTLDQDVADMLEDTFRATQIGVATLATTLGMSTKSIEDYTYRMKINLKGLSDLQMSEKIGAEFTKMQNEMSEGVLREWSMTKIDPADIILKEQSGFLKKILNSALDRVFKITLTEGLDVSKFISKDQLDDVWKTLLRPIDDKGTLETASQLLERLSTTLGTVNGSLDTLGFKMLELSIDSAITATALTDAFGGVDKYVEAMSFFYDNFYTEQEKVTELTEQLTTAFGNLGFELPKTTQEFRDLMQAAIESGDYGLAANLEKLQYKFIDLVGPIGEAEERFKELTSSILDEINRLRGAIISDSGVSGNVSGLTAEFAILSAQARAGSTTALEKLPEYSQAIEQAVAASAVNASDVAYARAWLAESLGSTTNVLTGVEPDTTVGSFTQDVATPSTVNGTAVLTASTSSQSELIAALVAEVQGLRAEVRADVAANNKTAKILERANQDGDTLRVTVVA